MTSPNTTILETPGSALSHEAFYQFCQQGTRIEDYPLAARIASRVPVYSGAVALEHAESPTGRRALLAEWHRCLLEGPGVLVLQGMYADLDVVDMASRCFEAIIEEERNSAGDGDHFAPPGSNDRIWNAFQKHGERDPANFLDYYSNPLLGLVSEAWLGPGYQLTAQVNVVKPGGKPQSPHRDYHLGFQSPDMVARYPLAVQHASQLLTLQGAVAHSDMPTETGPTRLLPYSQRYREGYLAYHDPALRDYFQEHFVHLPLAKGDGLFFSPALFHAAGENRTHDRRRMANLLQVSSAFGRAMETVDTRRLIEACYEALTQRVASFGLAAPQTRACIDAVAEAYPFPTNLDRTPPIDGMAPESQHQLLERALKEAWPLDQLRQALKGQEKARQA
uniref:phytanoyl-CoA dioxygenase family protein n=1 Tax=uncultured Halomonas sp. TaxID=173971 RepID=UPI002628AEB5|nr:phytanoyl-CoA dioxygenase family protein [uncultured Halomonas sp.]